MHLKEKNIKGKTKQKPVYRKIQKNNWHGKRYKTKMSVKLSQKFSGHSNEKGKIPHSINGIKKIPLKILIKIISN